MAREILEKLDPEDRTLSEYHMKRPVYRAKMIENIDGVTLEAKEGSIRDGNMGDYIMVFPNGDQKIMGKKEFENLFERT